MFENVDVFKVEASTDVDTESHCFMAPLLFLMESL